MPEIHERIYELAKESLAHQERQVAELRTRGTGPLTGGVVIAGLLAQPAFRNGGPDGAIGWCTTVVGLGGAVVLLVTVVALASPTPLAFEADGAVAFERLWNSGLVEQPDVDMELAASFDRRCTTNDARVARLRAALWCAIAALLAETAGLALTSAVSS